MAKVKPIGNRLLIKLTPQSSERVVGGIVVSTNAKNDTPHTGTIIDIGAKVEGFTIGEVIIFGKYALTEVNIDGEKFHLINQEEVLGVLS
jgi:chaperonin GroES